MVEYKAEQYQLQQKVYSTQQSTKGTESYQHTSLLQWPVTSRSRAPTNPKGFQLSSFLPEGPPQQHRMQDPASAVLHSICKLTTQGRGESAFFSNQRWSDAPFPGVQPPSLKAAHATQACSFPWRRWHIPTSQPALPQHCTTFPAGEKGSKIRTSW